MSLPVFFRGAAKRDLEEIEDWYEGQRAGLGTEFRQAIDDLVGRISADPFAYPELLPGARRARVKRFPYLLWYQVGPEQAVVLACIHGKRGPHALRERVGEGV